MWSALLVFPTTAFAQGSNLPVIQESVDEIVILQTVDNEYARVVFIRDGSVLATRLLLDDMLWTTDSEKFVLVWQDYSTAERVVEASKFSVVVTATDPTQADRCGPWWCMFRNMRDLKQP